ncbi:tRNA synthetases class I-domain-containing protein [Amylocarpus encephaloides]|uniref:Tyrosine--tRNA ligase n=1 Tax=Amylocarpus encephaloides TaxID=45428 RepID=A0A9P7YQL8_9HELO|nr:tRNA synthetases class I-domain-containing protein [Amylocarpus encephaloides]
MASEISPQESITLIKANLAEVLNPEIIDDVILTQKRPLKVYWGTATTGKPHCGYFVPIIKIAELLAAGCHIKILLADVHGFLDDTSKAGWERVQLRAKYYEYAIKGLLKSVGVDLSRLEFVTGSSYQYSKEYTHDRFLLEHQTRIATAQKAGAEVVKNDGNPTISGLVYPLMQALDEQYLDVDAQFGGVDQRKIFTFALENLPKLGYKVRAHLMNTMVPGLGEAAKMSASDPDSKIDLLEAPDKVKTKLKKAKCVPKEVEGNGVIAFVEHVILRALALKKDHDGKFTVERNDQEPLIYESAEKLKGDYAADILTPQLLKAALTTHLNAILAPIRAEYDASPEWQSVCESAYPTVVVEKVKKVKDKGDPAKRAAAALARQAQGKTAVPVEEGVEKLAINDAP